MTKPNTQKLSWLEEGDRFEIPSLDGLMRNLSVVYSNPSGTTVTGEKRDSINEEWKSFRFPISNDLNVVLLAKGAPKVKDTPKTDDVTETPIKRRGRPSKRGNDISNLKGTKGEFTVKDLVEKNGLKEYEAQNIIRKAQKNGKVKDAGQIVGGRGKPRKIYKLV